MEFQVQMITRLLCIFVFTSALFAEEVKLDAGAVEHLKKYCYDCHDSETQKGKLNIEALLKEGFDKNLILWEKVLRNIETRKMPPIGKKRPDADIYNIIQNSLTFTIDKEVGNHTVYLESGSVRRLTRVEYKNAIRDLLGIDLEISDLLPADPVSHGFDNITVKDLSPALLDKYVSAALKISRLAVGSNYSRPEGRTIRISPEVTQEGHVKGLPFGTRGGVSISHNFPMDGEYEIRVTLTRDRDEKVEGISGVETMEILLDNEQRNSFKIKKLADHSKIDAHLKARLSVKGGKHSLGVTFIEKSRVIEEYLRQPYMSKINLHRSPRLSPAVYQVSIIGPYNGNAAISSESYKKIFTDFPKHEKKEAACAEKIIKNLTRMAFRRPVTESDYGKISNIYEMSRKSGADFKTAIEAALSAILISRKFLFRLSENSDRNADQNFELAEKLSFFLWSSIPDEELLSKAEDGTLKSKKVLELQVKRMLADPKSGSLVNNFAVQWLYLRNLKAVHPNARLYPDFDDNLRQAFRDETELLFQEVLNENKSVLDLIKSDHTYLNERLAKHYGISGIYGSNFRKVTLNPESQRGGILRHGSILSVTSYADRTSPVIRGHWILDNILGSPPPPPPPNVSTLEDDEISADLPFRQRLAKHSENATCASCHNTMDPIGFAMENYDAVGKWRTLDNSYPVDNKGGFVDGSQFSGVEGLEKALLDRPRLFVNALTEKFFIYGLGRGVELEERVYVRKVVSAAAKDNYALHSIIMEIVKSPLFIGKLEE